MRLGLRDFLEAMERGFGCWSERYFRERGGSCIEERGSLGRELPGGGFSSF